MVREILKRFLFYFQRTVFTLVIVIFGFQNLLSQPRNFELKQISEEHGLPGVTVRAIFQDSKNILWFGIESAGLCKYDGETFTLYSDNIRDACSLGSNFVNSICEDTDGYLWIGTDNGLYKFNRIAEKFTRYYSNANHKNSLNGNQIYSVKVDSKGELWVGTNNGLNIYDKKNDQFIRLPYSDKGKELNFQVNSICFDSKNNTWIATLEGLFKVESQNHHFTHWINLPKQVNSLPSNQIKDLCFDLQGSLWMVTNIGCVRYDVNKDVFYELKELNRKAFKSIYNSPAFMLCDKKGFIWVSTEGIAVINPQNNAYTIYHESFDNPNGLKNNDIRSIYEDKSGLVWIGAKFEGLQIYNPRKELFPLWKNQIDKDNKGLNDKYIFAISEDNDQNIWIGTRYGGLNKFDRKTGIFTYFTHNNNPASIAENEVFVLLPDRKNNIWMASTNYLEKFDFKRKRFTNYPIKGIVSLMNDFRGNLWVGARSGLYIFDEANSKLNAFHDPDKVFPEKNDLSIFSLFQDKEGHIWIGTYRDGLYEYNPNTHKVIQYRNNPDDSTSLSDDMIRSIYEDKKGRLWIGTRLQGLDLFDRKNKKFISYTKINGLPSNSIYSILEDSQGNLWLATHNGISKFNPDTKIFENFNKDFGLQDNVFAIGAKCKCRSGELLFGGNNGFNMFKPEEIKKEIYRGPLVITSIKIFDKTIYRDLSKPVNITLPYNQNYLSFSFTLLDYDNPLKNQYFYKMENIDKDWINCGNRHYASYSSLTPGNYYFSVKAENANGIGNEKGLSITITILPPWWQTIWFRLFAIVFIISSLIGFYLYRVNTLNKQKIHLQKLILDRTKELNETNSLLEERQQYIEEQNELLVGQTEKLNETNTMLEGKQQHIEEQSVKISQANNQLITLNATKDKFFSIIAHDLRNPFGAILGICELLTINYEKFDDAKRKKLINAVYESADNIYKLLENLLQWSRTQTGNIEYEPEEFALSELIDSNIVLIDTMLKRKNLEIICHGAKDLTVYADKNMINTVLRNLITNAIKFTNNGNIYITWEQNNSFIMVKVIDTGIGIKQEKLNDIFNIEVSKSTHGTSGETGTGLGLLLCKEFVIKNNGSIYVESEEGKGSTFTFTLPISSK
jgi:ligand-binding sensor domain-containing protein/signal transduction histidine kinase